MQWLIDLIIERIGIPPVYIGRPTGVKDWTHATLTIDGNWHELDLSSIVPTGAKGVHFDITGRCNDVDSQLFIKRAGQGGLSTHRVLVSQVAGIGNGSQCVIAVDSDRKVDYKIQNDDWTSIAFTIKGWWL